MVSKIEVFLHVYDIMHAFLVTFPQVVQYSNLYESLVMESLLIPNDFDCHMLLGHVIESSDHLSEATFTYHL